MYSQKLVLTLLQLLRNSMYKQIYTAFKVNRDTGKGLCFTATNMRALSKHTGLGYDNLVRIFTRNRKDYWSGPDGWEVVRSVTHFLGERRGFKNKLPNK